MIISSDNLSKTMKKFKSYTAKELINLLQKSKARIILEQIYEEIKVKLRDNYIHFKKGID